MRPAKQTILEVLSRGIPRRGLPPVCYRASSELPRWPHNIRTGTRATYVRRLSGCFAIKSREGHRLCCYFCSRMCPLSLKGRAARWAGQEATTKSKDVREIKA